MSRSRARDRSRPSGGAALWTPRLLVPTAWYRADFGATGSPVSSWAEYPGGRGDAATQGTLANRPAAPAARSALNDQLALSFDGTDVLNGGADIDCSTAITACVVVETSTLGNEDGYIRLASTETAGAPGGFVAYSISDGRFVVANAATTWNRVYTSCVSSNTAHAILITCAGSFASLDVQIGTISGGAISWVTATTQSTTGTLALPASTAQRTRIGGGWNSATSLFSGYIAEQIIWGSVLSAGNLSSLKSYLQSRFA